MSQPTLRREGDARLAGCVFNERNTRGVATNVYLRKMLEKPKVGLRILRTKVWELFTCEEGISTPRARHKGRQPLIMCANMTSYCFIFPFTFFMSFYSFCIFYLFAVDKGVFLAPTYSSIVIRKSDLLSSLRTKRWLSCFYPFCKIYFD